MTHQEPDNEVRIKLLDALEESLLRALVILRRAEGGDIAAREEAALGALRELRKVEDMAKRHWGPGIVPGEEVIP